MLRLASILYSVIGTTLAGSFMIAGLTMGYDTLYPILIAVALGAVVALPITWIISKKIIDN
jgi:H+/Cl- antiporter ClcA